MDDDTNTPGEAAAGRVHDHVAARRDDWQRIRLMLTLLTVETGDDLPTTLAHELLDHALALATAACGIEVTAGDHW